ncbi:MAG: hypothetical protein HWE34_07510 [Methylocystaceae bacterium]|nr:hypothetical protein [Methylocystaceae bacterium]
MMTILVLMLMLTLFVFMSYMKYQNILSDVVSSRLMVVAGSIENVVEHATSLGLKFQEINQLETILESSRKLDEGIEEIAVVNTNGKIIYSSKKERVSDIVADTIVQNVALETKTQWTIEEDDFLFVGLNIRNAVDLPLGSVVIKYSKAEYNVAVSNIFDQLTFGAFVTLLSFSVLLSILIKVSFSKFNRFYNTLYSELSQPQGDLNNKDETTYLSADVKKVRQNQLLILKELDAVKSKILPTGTGDAYE